MSRFFRQAADSDSESSDSEESLLSSDEDASPAKPAAPAKPAMSRFLRTANASDSSSSESESEDDDESDDEGAAQKEAKPKPRFLRDSDEEDSDEEVKRVVKSARDKRLEEMEATGKAMDNALKINDWIAISSGKSLIHMYIYVLPVAHFRGLLLEYDKLIRMVQRQQNVAEPVPPFYIRTLISLEVALNAALAKEKEAKKKMNASNARALTAMKQKVRKTVKEHEKEIRQYNDVRGPCRLFMLLAAYRLPGSGGIRARIRSSCRSTSPSKAGSSQKVRYFGGRGRRRLYSGWKGRESHPVHG